MKRIKIYAILLAVAIIAGVSIFYACEKEKDNSLNQEKVLKAQLEELNSTLNFTNDSKGPFLEALKKAVVIAGADIVGAGAGAKAGSYVAGAVTVITGGAGAGAGSAIIAGCAVVAGAGASIAATSSVTNNNGNNNENGSKTGYDISYPFEVDPSSYGFLHNQIVEKNYHSFPVSLNNTSEYYANFKMDETLKLFFSDEFQKHYRQIESYAKIYSKEPNIMKHIKLNNLPANVVLVYDYFFKEYFKITNENDIIETTNAYYTFVQKNTILSDEEKQILLPSISVAKYSPFLWLSVIN